MALLFMSTFDKSEDWRRALTDALPDLEFRKFPEETGDPAEVEFALVWRPKPGSLLAYPNLKTIFSLGAGVDHILLGGGDLPKDVPIVRLIDAALTSDMTQYVVHWALHFHRSFQIYRAAQAEARWSRLPYPAAAERRIGILGLGVLGSDTARALVTMGFDVAGWSRSPKAIDGVMSFHGAGRLMDFLARSDILICLLPLTPNTQGLLNGERLAALPRGAFVINPARGAHVVDADLLAALDSGQIDGAALDVFAREPLASDHPFWRHPKVIVTPHIASHTTPRSAAAQVAANIQRIRRGEQPENQVDPTRMY